MILNTNNVDIQSKNDPIEYRNPIEVILSSIPLWTLLLALALPPLVQRPAVEIAVITETDKSGVLAQAGPMWAQLSYADRGSELCG